MKNPLLHRMQTGIRTFAKHWGYGALLFLFFCLFNYQSKAQCGTGDSQIIPINLSSKIDTIWRSTLGREGTSTCNVNGDKQDECIRFKVKIHPGADLLTFTAGQFTNVSVYSINCGTPVNIGVPACITGLDSVCITFCKPGKNAIEYTIRTSTLVKGSGDLNLREGCSGTMSVTGLQTDINWTSISPGPVGTYNTYLNQLNTASVVVTPGLNAPDSIDYVVSGTGTCAGLKRDTIRVYTSPALTIGLAPLNPAICSGASVLLTTNPTGGSGPYTYTWSGAGGSTTSTITASTIGKYVITIRDTISACPAVKDSVTVTAAPTPAAPTASGTVICAGTSASLTATQPGGTYQWYTAATGGTLRFTGPNFTTPILNSDTTYYVQTTVNNCTGPRTAVTVTVTPLPASPSAAAVAICSGNSTTLTATAPGGNYDWYAAATGGTSLSNLPTFTTPVLTTTTTYHVTSTVNSCSSAVRTPVTVTVNAIPAMPTANGSTICAGTTATLTASNSGAVYEWYDAATGGNLLSTNASFTTPILNANTTYHVQSRINNCVGPRRAVTVTVTALDNSSFTYSSSTFCVTGTNPTPTITGRTGGTFSATPVGLSLNATTGGINVSTSTLGTYNVTYLTNGPCPSSSVVTVTITNTPNAAFSYNGPFCQRQTNPTPVFLTGASAGVFTSTTGLVFLNANTGLIDLTNSSAGTYDITNSINLVGCAPATDTKSITINPVATVDAGADQTVCAGTTVNLSATIGGSATGITWSSNPGTGSFGNTNQATTTYTPATGETIVKLYATTNTPTAPCSATRDSLTLTITPIPNAPTVAGTTICAGTSTSLTATAPGGNYEWFANASGGTSIGSGATLSTGILNATTTFYVQTTLNNCTSVRTPVTVTVTPLPNAPTVAGAAICSGNTASLSATAPAGAIYQWYTAATGGSPFLSGTTYTTPVLTTTTSFFAQSLLNNCTSSTRTEVVVTVNPIPAAPTATGVTICAGNTTTLTASVSGNVYQWYDAASGGNLLQTGASYTTPPLNTTTTYQVQSVTNSCTGPRTPVTVAVTAIDDPSFSYSSGTFCITGTSNPSPAITGKPGGSFSATPAGLSLNASNGTVTLNTSIIGTYTITYLTNGSCPSSRSVTLTITASPNAAFSYNTPFCQQQTNPLPTFPTGASAGVFSSTAGLNFVNPNSGLINLNTSTPGTYTLTNSIAAAAGCSAASATNTVTINPLATVDAGANQSVCAGVPVSLTASIGGAATDVAWSGGSGSFSNNALLNTIYTPAAGETSVMLFVLTNDPAGPCAAVRDSLLLSITPTPAAPTTAGTTICAGTTAVLSSTAPGGIYTWFDAPSGGTLIGTGNSFTTPVLNTTTTYYVNSTINNCTGPSMPVTVVVNPLPAAPTASGTTICSGNNATLTANTTSGSHQWYSAANGGTLLSSTAAYTTPILNTTTIFYVQNTVNNCAGPRTAVTVTVNATPAAPAAAGATICEGTATTLTTTASGASYQWFGVASGGTALSSNASFTTPILNVTTTFYVEASAAGCIGPRTAVLATVIPNANPAFLYPSGTFCKTGSNPTPSVVGNATGTFSASSTGLVFVSNTTGQIDVSASALGNYTITFTTNGTCVFSSSVSVTITNNPNAAFTYPNVSYCEKQTNPVPVFQPGTSAGVFSAAPNGLVFLNASTGEIDLLRSVAGSYTLTNTIAASGGCAIASSTSNLMIDPIPVVDAGNPQTICAATSVALTGIMGASATSVSWSGGRGSFSNPTSLNSSYTPASGESSVQLYLTTNDPAGPCNAVRDSMTLTITPLPAAPTAFNTTICTGTSANLNAVATAGNYTWYDAATGGNLLASNASFSTPILNTSTTYFVQNTLNNCAGPRTPVIASVTSIPAAPTAAAASICAGITATLTATAPGGSYQWYDASTAGNLLKNDSTFTTPILTSNTTYYVQSTINNCAGPRSPVNVSVTPTPATPLVNRNTPICVGSTLNLTTASVPNATYAWTGPNNYISSEQNPTLNNMASVNAGVYAVTITVNGCTSNAGTNNVSPIIAIPKANSNSPICENNNLNLSATAIAGASYSWTGPNGFNASTQNPSLVGMTNNSGTYYVTASLAGCPGLTDSALVTVNANPITPTLTTNAPVCAGDSITLSASFMRGARYSWTGPNTFSSFLQNPVLQNSLPGNSGLYTVSVTAPGCTTTRTASLNITVNPIPATPIAGNNGPVCEGNNLTLLVSSLPGAQYSWTGPGGFTATGQSPQLNNITPSSADTFRVVATVNGCASAPASTRPIINQLTLAAAGNDQIVCANNAAVRLSGSITGGSTTGTWSSSGTGIFVPNATTLNASYLPGITDTAAGNVVLSLRGTNTGACPIPRSSLTVTITDAPTVNAGADQGICSNDPFARLGGTVQVASGGIWSTLGTGKFLPSNTDLNALYTPGTNDIKTGNVTLLLTSTNQGNCNAVSDSKIISITAAPVVNAGPDRLVIEDRTIRLEPVVTGLNLRYEWTPNLNLSNNTVKNPIVTAKISQVYTLKVTGEGNCVASDETFIKVLKPILVPNVFSPNGDGINDVWKIEQLINYPDALVEVFTRTGQRIYASVGYQKPWDGTYLNKPLPVATYYYIIEPKLTGTILSGSVTILR